MPVQHFINVLSAVLLGPWFGLAQAFLSSLIRLLFGLGTPFAFPGSMVGVLVASLFYYVNKHLFVASIGEVIGTGIIGSLLCIPLAWILGLEDMLIKPLMATFLLSSFVGASLSYFLLIVLKKRHQLPNLEQKSKRKF